MKQEKEVEHGGGVFEFPCAACKFLRRKCQPECVFAPYFPPDQPQKFVNVHKVFGASNITKLLNELHPSQREDAVNSLAYEGHAAARPSTAASGSSSRSSSTSSASSRWISAAPSLSCPRPEPRNHRTRRAHSRSSRRHQPNTSELGYQSDRERRRQRRRA
ncbi:LOB domain-containing protein 6 [Hibiscus syriacus]|uniref:LOB domain-containing protein 6 n=1 Tax=Hibiscus syriacus TaxID=106335 RepID=A0A6A2WI77_HIBSY|nr:LOB domain-containing protein 6 [Hibiscus syriacus]